MRNPKKWTKNYINYELGCAAKAGLLESDLPAEKKKRVIEYFALRC